MRVKEKLDQELKSAMLGGDKTLATTIRGIKSAILYAEVASGKRETGLSDEEITAILRKEASKRKESAELYVRGGNQEKADAEMAELKVIENYLPAQLSDEDLDKLVSQAIEETGEISNQNMGRIIGRVKDLSAGAADGGRIAEKVKGRLK